MPNVNGWIDTSQHKGFDPGRAVAYVWPGAIRPLYADLNCPRLVHTLSWARSACSMLIPSPLESFTLDLNSPEVSFERGLRAVVGSDVSAISVNRLTFHRWVRVGLGLGLTLTLTLQALIDSTGSEWAGCGKLIGVFTE